MSGQSTLFALGLPTTSFSAVSDRNPGTKLEVGEILLADVARHVANALAEEMGLSREDSIQRIRELFNAEMDRPTDKPSGHFVS
jgi:hypothetical protein